MSAQVYSVPGQTEGRTKSFFGPEKHRLIPYISLNFLLHVGVMLAIIKVFINLFLLVRIGNILAIFKMNQ